MPVYRLTPVEAAKTSPQWEASSIKPYCLWIQARNEHDARAAVAQATAVTTWRGLQADPPWYDETLVSCENDQDKDLASGIIWVRSAAPRLMPSKTMAMELHA